MQFAIFVEACGDTRFHVASMPQSETLHKELVDYSVNERACYAKLIWPTYMRMTDVGLTEAERAAIVEFETWAKEAMRCPNPNCGSLSCNCGLSPDDPNEHANAPGEDEIDAFLDSPDPFHLGPP